MKPKHLLQGGMIYTLGYYPIHKMWDINRKLPRESFGRKENQLDIFIFLGQNYVRLKVIWQWYHVYKMLLLILPLGLENTSTNWNFTDSDLLEEWKIKIDWDQKYLMCEKCYKGDSNIQNRSRTLGYSQYSKKSPWWSVHMYMFSQIWWI